MSEITVEQEVRKEFPNAFIHDDGEKVYLYSGALEEYQCPHCKHVSMRKSYSNQHIIGWGGSNSAAYEKALNTVKIIQTQREQKKLEISVSANAT